MPSCTAKGCGDMVMQCDGRKGWSYDLCIM